LISRPPPLILAEVATPLRYALHYAELSLKVTPQIVTRIHEDTPRYYKRRDDAADTPYAIIIDDDTPCLLLPSYAASGAAVRQGSGGAAEISLAVIERIVLYR